MITQETAESLKGAKIITTKGLISARAYRQAVISTPKYTRYFAKYGSIQPTYATSTRARVWGRPLKNVCLPSVYKGGQTDQLASSLIQGLSVAKTTVSADCLTTAKGLIVSGLAKPSVSEFMSNPLPVGTDDAADNLIALVDVLQKNWHQLANCKIKRDFNTR